MLPPPGVPLLIWSMSWSRVSRVPTARQVGPATAADALEGVAVPAVLVLEHHGPLQLQRGRIA